MAGSSKDGKKDFETQVGNGGELHQQATGPENRMTTAQGVPISDDQNSLTAGERGPTLLEDFVMREKITHFDHERIPERVVHARGYGIHGVFQAYDSNSDLTKAAFLQPGVETEVFVRFSTVAGSKGSFDTARDVRGFAVKFYTSEGNYDLVGNNIPVFFIQDAIKFPDLIHAVKPEPDRDFPQAQSAHNTFWDYVSLTPESMHMLMWAMSDRAIPRSLRMMEGFGVHTFRMENANGDVKFVKFHWRPVLGTFSLIWDEALVVNGADPDFHRRDMWNAIEKGDYPEWELCVQAFTAEEAEKFDFDVLDPTKLVPEEMVPLQPLGKMTLNRNVDNFFAETEQVAFCPSHVVPGIDFTNDPLLQGRLHSYLDTQLSRLGSPNFHQIPVNKPRCPFHNLQRDGHMQMDVPTGRVANEPNSLSKETPRECTETGFRTIPAHEEGPKLRIRPEAFADHYTQARLFYRSMTSYEKNHIVGGFAFELGKCDELKIRRRMLGHLQNIDEDLAAKVAKKLGMEGQADSIKPAQPVRDVEPSDALSQYKKAPRSIAGRKIGLLTTAGVDAEFVKSLQQALKQEQASLAIIAPTAGPFKDSEGNEIVPDDFLDGAPSAIFDAVVVAPGPQAKDMLLSTANAVNWPRMAYGHLKAIAFTAEAADLLQKGNVPTSNEDGVDEVDSSSPDWSSFIENAKRHRIWDREAKVSPR